MSKTDDLLKAIRKDELAIMMLERGVVKRDLDDNFSFNKKPSRGYYIVLLPNGIFYLHHDGTIKDGVKSKSKNPAFWDSKEEAEEFFEHWKSGIDI